MLRGLVRLHLLRIVVSHHASSFDDGVQSTILRVGKLDEAIERCFTSEGIWTEAIDIGFVLPVVALLQQRKTSAPYYDVFQLHAAVRLVQHGSDDHAAAASQQCFGKRDDEVEYDTSVTFGYGPHLRYDCHLLDLKGHDALSVDERIDRCKVKYIAVTFELHDLRSAFWLPLQPFGA